MLRQVQVLLERAAGDAEGAADLLRRDAPRDLVVSGLERGHEGGRLLRGKGREEEGRAERLSRGSVREGALRQEPPPGEEGRELADHRARGTQDLSRVVEVLLASRALEEEVRPDGIGVDDEAFVAGRE